MDSTDDLLDERGEQYGDYETQAYLTQVLKSFFRDGSTWNELLDAERESLDMIASKISRIVNGRVLQEDSWADIAGYARLVENAISAKLARDDD